MKKLILYIGLFWAVCLVPSAGLLFYSESGSTENRDLAEAPALRSEEGWNRDFLGDAGAYFEDHFAFRSELVTGNALVTDRLFGVSADDGVISGDDGWLYYMDSLEDYQGSEQMTERQLFDTAHTLAMIQRYAGEQGAEFLFAIAPNKNSLYGEHMPYYYRAYREKQNNRTRLREYLDEEEVHYIDLYDSLADYDEVLYHLRDSHWNNRGASIAVDGILQSLEKKHASYTDRDYETRDDFEGDLDAMLFPKAVTPEAEIYYTPEPDFTYIGEVESNFDPKIYTESKAGKGSLVMYRDSFGNALVPFMAEAYGSAYFSRAIPYQLADLLACKADTLVIERAERFLPEIAGSAPVMTAGLTSAAELGDMEYTADIPELETAPQGNLTRISGGVPAESLKTKSLVYVRVGGVLNYEAFPVTRADGTEGFELYIPSAVLEKYSGLELGVSP